MFVCCAMIGCTVALPAVLLRTLMRLVSTRWRCHQIKKKNQGISFLAISPLKFYVIGGQDRRISEESAHWIYVVVDSESNSLEGPAWKMVDGNLHSNKNLTLNLNPCSFAWEVVFVVACPQSKKHSFCAQFFFCVPLSACFSDSLVTAICKNFVKSCLLFFFCGHPLQTCCVSSLKRTSGPGLEEACTLQQVAANWSFCACMTVVSVECCCQERPASMWLLSV